MAVAQAMESADRSTEIEKEAGRFAPESQVDMRRLVRTALRLAPRPHHPGHPAPPSTFHASSAEGTVAPVDGPAETAVICRPGSPWAASTRARRTQFTADQCSLDRLRRRARPRPPQAAYYRSLAPQVVPLDNMALEQYTSQNSRTYLSC